MASAGTARANSPVAMLLAGDSRYWLAIWVLALPWVRYSFGPWVLYPGHVALGLLLAGTLIAEGGWGVALRPLAPLLLLGGYIAAVAALREQWTLMALALATTGGNVWWGAAAFRLGLQSRDTRPVQEGLVGLFGLILAVGLLFWVVRGFWPGACAVLNCAANGYWPYPFTGGLGNEAAYLLALLFLLAPVGAPFLAALHGRALRPALGLGAGGVLALLGLLAGAALWVWLLLALAWLLLLRLHPPGASGANRLLVRGTAFGLVFLAVSVYGLEPGYLRGPAAGAVTPTARLALPEAPPRSLTSAASRAVPVRVHNTGWNTLGGEGGAALRLGARILITPERGDTRIYDLGTVPVPGRLAPGDARQVVLSLQPPHWLREGYLAWYLVQGENAPVRLDDASQQGFRFVNTAFRRIAHDPENRLSVLAQRARAFAAEAEARPDRAPPAHTWSLVLGDVLDTVFFSPLWGEVEPAAAGHAPFGTPRPFLPALLHQYGLIGLALALWFAWRLLTRALAIAQGGGPAWQLLPLALLLLFAAALFTPVVGSYHGHWAFILLAGFLEGRYAQRHPPRAGLPTLRWPTLPWPRLPRLPRWGRGAASPRRRATRRPARRTRIR